MASRSDTAVRYKSDRLADYTDDTNVERGSVDLPFALLSMLLLTVGVIMVLSASFARAYYDPSGTTGGNATYYFVRQALFAMTGVGVMFLFSRFPMSLYQGFSKVVMIGSVIMLAAVLVPGIGEKANNARRWINLHFTTFQPSEVAKIAVILYFSALICRSKNGLKSIKSLVPFAFWLGIIVVLRCLRR